MEVRCRVVDAGKAKLNRPTVLPNPARQNAWLPQNGDTRVKCRRGTMSTLTRRLASGDAMPFKVPRLDGSFALAMTAEPLAFGCCRRDSSSRTMSAEACNCDSDGSNVHSSHLSRVAAVSPREGSERNCTPFTPPLPLMLLPMSGMRGLRRMPTILPLATSHPPRSHVASATRMTRRFSQSDERC